MEIIKPKKLEKGDTIGIVSPSSGLADLAPHRLDNAIKFLKDKGFKIKEFPTTRKRSGWESASAEERAKDLMEAFEDEGVKAIVCSIGGNTANKILKYLDFDKIKNNPKIFCGYSDASVIHYALNTQANLVTFYGPCMMVQFGEYPETLSYTWEHFLKATSGIIGEIKASERWTDEILNWFEKEDLKRPRELKENKGFEWLRKGEATGKIIGGCISSIVHLRGTKFWPEHKDRILLVEIPEGQEFDQGEPVEVVDAILADLELSGVFRDIKGLIIGRPFRYDKEQINDLKRVVLENTKDYNFPILFNVDIGHTDPQITIPLGVEVKIDSNKNTFNIEESGII